MRIGFLLGNLQGNGGIARVVSIIANELCADNDIFIISFCPAIEPAGYTYNVKIHCVRLYDNRISMTNAILRCHAVSKVREYLKKKQIDILLACGELYFPLAILATNKTHAKCFCWEHSDPAGTNDHRFQMLSRRFAVRAADKIIVLTKAAQCYYEKELKCNKRKITQLYNPVGKKVAQSEGYDSTSRVILSVGRLTYQKNFQLLVKIASIILTKYPDWKWEICGEGEERKELEKLIADNRLEGKLILRGQVKNIYSEYKKYSFMVMTSRYEGFPMTLIEAEANRLPLIAFDIPTGPNEIIEDGVNGYLIRNNNIDSMIAKIIELIENESLREKMAESGYKKANEFQIDKILKQWRRICMQ